MLIWDLCSGICVPWSNAEAQKSTTPNVVLFGPGPVGMSTGSPFCFFLFFFCSIHHMFFCVALSESVSCATSCPNKNWRQAELGVIMRNTAPNQTQSAKKPAASKCFGQLLNMQSFGQRLYTAAHWPKATIEKRKIKKSSGEKKMMNHNRWSAEGDDCLA